MPRRFVFLLLVLIAGCGPQPQPTAVAPPSVAAPPAMSDAEAREAVTKRLKAIGLALHNLHDAYGQFPASSTTLDGNGLSWRVQILPYLGDEGAKLYAKFHPYEPWDSPHNKTLIDQMPAVYASPGKPTEKGMTHVCGFIGPNAFFNSKPQQWGEVPLDFASDGRDRKPDPNGPKVKTARGRGILNILDGTTNTFMAVEAAEPVVWTKPDELKYDGKDLPKLGGVFADGFHGLMGDGRVYFFPTAVTTDTMLRGLITIDGNEFVDLNPIRKANGEKEVEYRKPTAPPNPNEPKPPVAKPPGK